MTGHSLIEHDRREGTTLVCSCGGWSVTSAVRLGEAPAEPVLMNYRQDWLQHARTTRLRDENTMTLVEFCEKVETNGGVIDALRFGLTAEELTAVDLRGAELYDIWETLETAWQVIGRLEEEATRIIDAVLDARDDEA